MPWQNDYLAYIRYPFMTNIKPTKARAADHSLANSPVGREKPPTRRKDNC